MSGATGSARPRLRPGTGRWFLRDCALVLAAAVLLLASFTQISWLFSTREADTRVLVDIPEGATLRGIASILDDAGLVTDRPKFVLAARLLGLAGRLQAGTYEFGPRFSQMEILSALKYGEVAGRHVTVPEGYRASEVAALLQKTVGIDAAEFMDLVYDPAVLAELGVSAPSLEGHLHPDTYRIRLDASPRSVVDMMVGETLRVFDARRSARADSLGMTVNEVLTLASIIEAEAMIDRERPMISAVYHNRLEHGWRLEADPTVRYALGKYHRKLYFKDLQFDSPYNTYRVSGLPPGPICNPGTASIDAALYPTPGSRDFFFVSNGDGTHTFSRTFAEHVRAKELLRERPEGRPGGFSLDTDGNG
jgi:UPF0755 protein